MQNQSIQQPLLRWAGSKKKLIPELSKHWNSSYDRYVEPFVGSACLFFSIKPPSALLSDINDELITTYEEIRKNPKRVLAGIQKFKVNEKEYYKVRALNPKELSPSIRAARFIYLNRYCFNGLYRTNSTGRFNVPYGGSKRGEMPGQIVFYNCSNLLKKSQLVSASFEKVLAKVKKGDFVYMDPPFSVKSAKIFKQYDPSGFGQKEIKTLRKFMELFDKKGISFLVSYAESEEANMLKKGFYSKTVVVRRSIAGFLSDRKLAKEILIFNKKPKNI